MNQTLSIETMLFQYQTVHFGWWRTKDSLKTSTSLTLRSTCHTGSVNSYQECQKEYLFCEISEDLQRHACTMLHKTENILCQIVFFWNAHHKLYRVHAIYSSALLLYAVHFGQIPWWYRLREKVFTMKNTKHYFNKKFRTWHLHNKVNKITHFQLYKTCSSNNFGSDTTSS